MAEPKAFRNNIIIAGLILFGIVALFTVSPIQNAIFGSAENTNSFGIFLTSEHLSGFSTWRGTGDWSRVRLEASPLISASDIISYTFKSHSMKLRPEMLSRISYELTEHSTKLHPKTASLPAAGIDGMPFVVVANGERIYLGVFVHGDSSASQAVPTILVEGLLMDGTQPADVLVIDRAYPLPKYGVGPDPRGDERIKMALAALHKLRNSRGL